jgi:PAS domain S-box-containing protein
VLSQRLRKLVEAVGAALRIRASGAGLLPAIAEQPPDLLLVDLDAEPPPDWTWSELPERLRATPQGELLPVMAMVAADGRGADLELPLAEGYHDALARDIGDRQLQNRLELHHKSRRLRLREANSYDHRDALLAIHETIRRSSRPEDFLDDVVRAVSRMVPSSRCGVILFHQRTGDGIIAAAADDPEMRGFVLSAERYPELVQVRELADTVKVPNLQDSPITASVRDLLEKVGTTASLAVPILTGDTVLGALFLRSTAADPEFTQRDIDVLELVAQVLARPLAQAAMVERLRLERDEEAQRRAGIEGRLRQTELLQTVFDRIPIGLASLDPQGNFLYANRACSEILDRPKEALLGTNFMELVQFNEQPHGARIAHAGRARRARTEDLHLGTEGGTKLIEFTANPLPHDEDGQILVVRNVTAERQQRRDVQRNRDFLESIIQTSSDAIVAADVDGRILHSNRAAELMLGYSGRELTGMHVSRVYPEGVGREVMRKLRSDRYGGHGRAAGMRVVLEGRQGEAIPVGMSAAILYEDGRETATVGVFHDLRPRQAIEEALAEATEQVRRLEAQATLARFAADSVPRLSAAIRVLRECLEGFADPGCNEERQAALLTRLWEQSEVLASQIRGLENATRLGHDQRLDAPHTEDPNDRDSSRV